LGEINRMRLSIAAIALSLAAPLTAHAQVQDRVINVPTDDPDMLAAKQQGRATLPDFFRHLGAPEKDEAGFSIKYDLVPESDAAEFIWAEILSHKGNVTVARLSNVPDDKRFEQGQEVTVPDAEIVDWSYWKGDVLQGSFTTRALLKTMSAEEAASLRKAVGW
jgi:uncharacterized protein YegJ (DUF2314 family)